MIADPTGVMPDTRPVTLLLQPPIPDPTGVMPATPAALFLTSDVSLPDSSGFPLRQPVRVTLGMPRRKFGVIAIAGTCHGADYVDFFEGPKVNLRHLITSINVEGKRRFSVELALDPGDMTFTASARTGAQRSAKITIRI